MSRLQPILSVVVAYSLLLACLCSSPIQALQKAQVLNQTHRLALPQTVIRVKTSADSLLVLMERHTRRRHGRRKNKGGYSRKRLRRYRSHRRGSHRRHH